MLKRFIFFVFLLNSTLGVCDNSIPHWDEVQAFLIPNEHPIKKTLDKLFQKSRPTASFRALRKAGFIFEIPRTPDRLTVAQHPKLKGYLLKIFRDDQLMVPDEAYHWIQRIIGTRLIQDSIDKHGYQQIMKAPKKWIYHLPHTALPRAGSFIRRYYLLVVEDMKVVNAIKNERYFRTKMTREKLEALYVILKENVLIDSIYIDNIPFCRDGKMAFVDTEHYHTDLKPLRLHRLTYRFAPEMQDYWQSLIQ
jgi:hypothetical protein